MNDLEQKTRELKKRLKSGILTKETLERNIISLGLYRRVSGVLGPFIIANANGRMIIRLRPKDFKMSMTEASIANRSNMAAANKFAMSVKTINSLYSVWGTAKVKGNNPFTRIIKYNKKHLVDDCPSRLNTITPEGYALFYDDLITAQRGGKIRISRNYNADESEKMVIVLALLKPKKKGLSNYELLELNNAPVIPGQVIELKEWQKEICRNYNKVIIYSAVILQKGKQTQWSNTSVLETEFDFSSAYYKAELQGYGQILQEVLTPSININNTIVIKPPGLNR